MLRSLYIVLLEINICLGLKHNLQRIIWIDDAEEISLSKTINDK